jgi:hypothetical protein
METKIMRAPSTLAARLRSVHHVWARFAGTRRGHEKRLRGAKGRRTNGATSALQQRGQLNRGTSVPEGTADSSGADGCDRARAGDRAETIAPSAPVCEVCRAGSCVITRRRAADNKCLCTVEMYVPMDRSEQECVPPPRVFLV